MTRLLLRAMHRAGHSLAPTDRHLGLLCELEPMLTAAGFHQVSLLTHLVNYSYGADVHEEWTQDFLLFSHVMLPFLIQMEVATPAQVNVLYQQQQREMRLPSFHAVLPFLTVWGRKA